MFNFSKYKYISLSASLVCIIVGFFITYIIHNGFAHSLDFNGGLRAVLQLPEKENKESIKMGDNGYKRLHADFNVDFSYNVIISHFIF